ncbi:N-terminal EF-hand calcium-binding protein 1-like [Lingula anatina]|uniref:N-terminal EF-hand calcium-binding protein 1-like n=1 Tax=Lingula anatina TaxID=7574 RepID=A0A1S3JPN4_LINAN|nr:N-terminal EF-hand calcium-binding protein 1-like [Lingula anatina]|eukprot:XP_013412335.1 N-terminal EF-hand calcium-binding protein 1-like [Lingula anatina]
MAEQEKGMSIFLDVFRRADKNDDGALSLEEFRAFFADGVITDEELGNLFRDIDTHKTNNLDTGELCTYFSQHLGPFKEMFGALEDLNHSMTKALNQSAQQYPTASFIEQFVSRFLMREMLNQLVAVQKPVETASDFIDEKAIKERSGISQASVSVDVQGETPGAVPGWLGRRARRQYSSQYSTGSEGGSAPLNMQIERLRGLVDRLENRVNFEGIKEEQKDVPEEQMMLLVHRRFPVSPDRMKAFRGSLRMYIEGTNEDERCLNVSVLTYSGSDMFILYEMWESKEAWKR